MIRHEASMDQRINDVLALWQNEASTKLPTLNALDPLHNIPNHVSWTMLVNLDGICRLVGDDVEAFLGCVCKGQQTTIAFQGTAGAMALKALTVAMEARRLEIRHGYSAGGSLSVAALPYVNEDNSPDPEVAGVMLVLSSTAHTLRAMNAAFDAASEVQTFSNAV